MSHLKDIDLKMELNLLEFETAFNIRYQITQFSENIYRSWSKNVKECVSEKNNFKGKTSENSRSTAVGATENDVCQTPDS